MNTLRSFLLNLHLRRNAIWMIPLLLIITFPLWSIPVGNFLAPRGDFSQDEEGTQQQERSFNLENVSITLQQDGQDTALIIASTAQTTSPEILLLNDVTAQIYSNDGDVTEVKAENGEYNSKKQNLTLIKDVVVHKTADKQTLYTQHLYYDNNAQKVHCPGTTLVVAPDASIRGGSFDYDIKTATYEFGKPVLCEITNFDNNTQ